ncbi:MAG TPA: hypothetical protein VH092_16400, partial [Urbifossiella sp.]|nr:hypothetical protein [Urbifossiella sp.]
MSLRLPAAVMAAVFLLPRAAVAADPPAAAQPSRAAADAALARTAAAMLAGVRSFTLENGLRVYLLPIANSPLVSTMVAYRVGSADEAA